MANNERIVYWVKMSLPFLILFFRMKLADIVESKHILPSADMLCIT